MTRKEFVKRLRQILSGRKSDLGDSPADEIIAFFLNRVSQKAGGAWDEDVALQEMRQLEWTFEVQPEEVRKASLVSENDALLALKAFLLDRKYDYTPILTSSSQTPEGFIQRNGTKYLCEVKSPLLKFDHKAGSFGYKFTTTHRKILDFIHKAKNQFDAYDPEHKFPHILIYTSAHIQLCWKNFFDAVKGGVENHQDKILQPDLRNTIIFQATKELISEIDGYVWFQINASKHFYQGSYFLNQRSVFFSMTQELFKNLYKIKLSDMDNFIVLDQRIC